MHSKKTILIVDDHKVNRQILVKILSSDYVIEQAENGQVALDVLHADPERISLVLLDIVMPVLDGYEVLRQMHEDAAMSKIPVIVASGQDAEDAEVKALSLGANDYVLKPYRPEIIKHRIAIPSISRKLPLSLIRFNMTRSPACTARTISICR